MASTPAADADTASRKQHPNPLVTSILGDLQYVPTAKAILDQPNFDPEVGQLQNMKSALQHPACREDVFALIARLTINSAPQEGDAESSRASSHEDAASLDQMSEQQSDHEHATATSAPVSIPSQAIAATADFDFGSAMPNVTLFQTDPQSIVKDFLLSLATTHTNHEILEKLNQGKSNDLWTSGRMSSRLAIAIARFAKAHNATKDAVRASLDRQRERNGVTRRMIDNRALLSTFAKAAKAEERVTGAGVPEKLNLLKDHKQAPAYDKKSKSGEPSSSKLPPKKTSSTDKTMDGVSGASDKAPVRPKSTKMKDTASNRPTAAASDSQSASVNTASTKMSDTISDHSSAADSDDGSPLSDLEELGRRFDADAAALDRITPSSDGQSALSDLNELEDRLAGYMPPTRTDGEENDRDDDDGNDGGAAEDDEEEVARRTAFLLELPSNGALRILLDEEKPDLTDLDDFLRIASTNSHAQIVRLARQDYPNIRINAAKVAAKIDEALSRIAVSRRIDVMRAREEFDRGQRANQVKDRHFGKAKVTDKNGIPKRVARYAIQWAAAIGNPYSPVEGVSASYDDDDEEGAMEEGDVDNTGVHRRDGY